ncbi:hypothetical protein RHDC4_00345 [Rhodocyclaceae bacterium]|nr:hypothetical protein RHDC4_00345 [Rhodocyclaceae bacterium]
MKLKTAAFAFGPPLLVTTVATIINPGWLREMPWAMVLTVSIIVGAIGAIVCRLVESSD